MEQVKQDADIQPLISKCLFNKPKIVTVGLLTLPVYYDPLYHLIPNVYIICG